MYVTVHDICIQTTGFAFFLIYCSTDSVQTNLQTQPYKKKKKKLQKITNFYSN